MAIVGLGYVGLPLAVAFAQAGAEVVGVDVDEAKVAALRGRAFTTSRTLPTRRSQPASERLTRLERSRALAECDAILICVPTPLTPNREPDLGPLLACARQLSGVVRAGQLVVLESTTYPGTTREQLAPLLEAGGPARRR